MLPFMLITEGRMRLIAQTVEPYLPNDGVDAYVFVIENLKPST